MQSVLVLYPLLQLALCLFSDMYWNFSSAHGVESGEFLMACYVLDALCNGFLSLILLLICFGWKFMNNSIQVLLDRTCIELNV